MKQLLLLLMCIPISCNLPDSKEPTEKILRLPQTIEEIKLNQKSYENQGYTAVIFPPELQTISARDYIFFAFSASNPIRKATMHKNLLQFNPTTLRFENFDLLQTLAGGGERTLFVMIHDKEETALFVGNETTHFAANEYRGKNLIAIVENKVQSRNYGAYSFADNQLKTVWLSSAITQKNQLGEGAFVNNPLKKVFLPLKLFEAIKSNIDSYFGTNVQYQKTTAGGPRLFLN